MYCLGATGAAGGDSGDCGVTDESRICIAGRLCESRTAICPATDCSARSPSAMVHGSHRSNAATGNAYPNPRTARNAFAIEGG